MEKQPGRNLAVQMEGMLTILSRGDQHKLSSDKGEARSMFVLA